ncbi:MAG: hypothetical protein KBS95_02105 [Alistipes sp.]|nr:hypothetical protein [Candidatus Alistipes equi]
MKTRIFSLIAVILPLCLSAQDIIVKKDGSIIKAIVTKVSEDEIEYRKFGSTSERIYSIETTRIQSISYEDGTVESFSAQEKVSQETGTIKAIPDVQKNAASVDFINSATPSFDLKTSNKKADFAILKYAITPQSVLVSNDLIISAETGFFYAPPSGLLTKVQTKNYTYADLLKKGLSLNFCTPSIRFYVTNRTDHILYLDLGNTFLSVGGNTMPYYVPGAKSTTSSTGHGASVNLGAVAGALGVGGAVGTLARGVSVGGGNSTSSNNITYNQRVIAVPPFSKIPLEPKIIMDGNALIAKTAYPLCVYYSGTILCGEHVEFSYENSPVKLQFYLTYSFTEDCSKSSRMDVELYGQTIYGIKIVNKKSVQLNPDMLIAVGRLVSRR